jgi:hypothetical protein
MKRLSLIGIFFMTLFFPFLARGEDSTLLLTLKTEVNKSIFKNELRAGLWKEGKDGFDPLDMEAMLNGLFDVYFEPTFSSGSSGHLLWWDIRSLKPSQEWKLQLKAPPRQLVVLEWKQIPYDPVHSSILYSLVDSETGRETGLDKESGILTFLTSGFKTFILKSRSR